MTHRNWNVFTISFLLVVLVSVLGTGAHAAPPHEIASPPHTAHPELVFDSTSTLSNLPPLQDTNHERQRWAQKFTQAKQKEKSRKTLALVTLIGGVGLTMIGPFTDTAATTWAGIGAMGVGSWSLISWKGAQQQRRELESEGRAKGYITRSASPRLEFAYAFRF